MSVIPNQLPPRCILCRKPSDLRCQRCKTRYCGITCKEKDWDFHYYLCKPLVTKFQDEHRPSSTHFRAIYIPARRGQAKLHWVDSSSTNLEGRFAMEEKASGQINDYPGRKSLLLPYYAFIDETSPQPFNETIHAWGPPGHLGPITGDVIVATFCEQNSELDIPSENITRLSWTDVTLPDFRLVVDAFRWSENNPVIVDPEGFLASTSIGDICQAVKVNAKRYLFGHKLPKLEKVHCLCSSDPVMTTDSLATKRLGIPLRLHLGEAESIGQLTSAQKQTLKGRPAETLATYLGIEQLDIEDQYLCTQLLACNALHDVVVFRTDKKPLLIIHLKAIDAFLKSISETPGVVSKIDLFELAQPGFSAIPLRSFIITDMKAYKKLNTEENFRKF